MLYLLPTPASADSGGSNPSNITLTDAVVRTDLGAHANSRHLLPTPRASMSTGPGSHGDGGLDLQTAIALLPTPDALHSRKHTRKGPLLHGITDWGKYLPAIERWEQVSGVPAPKPTEAAPKARAGRRLSPALSEWMMDVPAGFVTGPEVGLTRTEQLKAIGNGVVRSQAAAAIRHLLHIAATR